MGVSQISASFQNDGNFSQLDLQDLTIGGPVLRIETFRCSQPEGEFGTTVAGTSVKSIAGDDHLSPESNRLFRHVFSTGQPGNLKATLEIRELYEPSGRFEVRTRDIDADSPSFGTTLINDNVPTGNGVVISYALRQPENAKPADVVSPIKSGPIARITGLADLSSAPEQLGTPVKLLDRDQLSLMLQVNEYPLADLHQWAERVQRALSEMVEKCTSLRTHG